MIIEVITENKDILLLLTVITIITFLTSLIVIPYIIINLSPDYFILEKQSMYEYKYPFFRYLVLIVKNILGYILFLLGIIMLFIPGQGLLSIGLGILLMNFPGKKNVELKFFSNKKVNNVINLIRRKFGKDEIHF